jgi:hypothetical protein
MLEQSLDANQTRPLLARVHSSSDTQTQSAAALQQAHLESSVCNTDGDTPCHSARPRPLRQTVTHSGHGHRWPLASSTQAVNGTGTRVLFYSKTRNLWRAERVPRLMYAEYTGWAIKSLDKNAFKSQIYVKRLMDHPVFTMEQIYMHADRQNVWTGRKPLLKRQLGRQRTPNYVR